MSDLPFTITPEAAQQIEKILLDLQREPTLLGFATVIDIQTRGLGGDIFFGFPSLEYVMENDYVELDMVGFQVFAHKATINRLVGKRIEWIRGRGVPGVGRLAVKR